MVEAPPLSPITGPNRVVDAGAGGRGVAADVGVVEVDPRDEARGAGDGRDATAQASTLVGRDLAVGQGQHPGAELGQGNRSPAPSTPRLPVTVLDDNDTSKIPLGPDAATVVGLRAVGVDVGAVEAHHGPGPVAVDRDARPTVAVDPAADDVQRRRIVDLEGRSSRAGDREALQQQDAAAVEDRHRTARGLGQARLVATGDREQRHVVTVEDGDGRHDVIAGAHIDDLTSLAQGRDGVLDGVVVVAVEGRGGHVVDELVAVVVDGVADLDGTGVDRRIGVVAVAVADGEAIEVVVGIGGAGVGVGGRPIGRIPGIEGRGGGLVLAPPDDHTAPQREAQHSALHGSSPLSSRRQLSRQMAD